MSLTTRDYKALLELIDIIYTIPEQTVMFKTFCDRLQKLIPFKSAAYAPTNSRKAEIKFPGSIVYNAPMRPLLLFSQYYHKLHPYFDAVKRDGVARYLNKATNLTDLMPVSKLRNQEYGHDFMRLADVSYEICINLAAQGDSIGLLGFHRQRGERDFTARELRIMNLLIPHIARSFYRYGLIHRELLPSTAELVQGSQGELISMNAEAKRVLKGKPPAIVPLPRLNGRPTFFSTDTGIYRVRAVNDGKGKAVQIQLDPESGPFDLCERLEGFGLTKRQKEVALAAVRGLSNREIAEKLFVCEQTVKDHLHDIFERMHVRRRSELTARLLMPSVDDRIPSLPPPA